MFSNEDILSRLASDSDTQRWFDVCMQAYADKDLSNACYHCTLILSLTLIPHPWDCCYIVETYPSNKYNNLSFLLQNGRSQTGHKYRPKIVGKVFQTPMMSKDF